MLECRTHRHALSEERHILEPHR
ncbi:unnamed protein product [Ectocarpus sp. CCAP 1310/34]|nr:unnamed protein product [Ectocarpus sp. CCAP 1310/34]